MIGSRFFSFVPKRGWMKALCNPRAWWVTAPWCHCLAVPAACSHGTARCLFRCGSRRWDHTCLNIPAWHQLLTQGTEEKSWLQPHASHWSQQGGCISILNFFFLKHYLIGLFNQPVRFVVLTKLEPKKGDGPKMRVNCPISLLRPQN